jgi:hypothetical protein
MGIMNYQYVGGNKVLTSSADFNMLSNMLSKTLIRKVVIAKLIGSRTACFKHDSDGDLSQEHIRIAHILVCSEMPFI